MRIAGRATAQSALRELPVADAAWSFYLHNYLDDAWESGYAPTAHGFFGGFGQLVTARTTELAQMRDDAPPAEQSRWDGLHPSIAARVAAMGAHARRVGGSGHASGVGADPRLRGARRRARGPRGHGQRTHAAGLGGADRDLLRGTVPPSGTPDMVYRAAARVAGQQRANLGTVLDVVAGGRRAELEKDLGTEGAQLADLLELLVSQAAVQAGMARWRHSWSGPAELVGRDEQVLDLAPGRDARHCSRRPSRPPGRGWPRSVSTSRPPVRSRTPPRPTAARCSAGWPA